MRFRLIPRDESFFPLFDRQATIAAETAKWGAAIASTA